jgi:hypothetical protein
MVWFRSGGKQWVWFVGLWAMSVAVLALIGGLIRWVLS